MWNVGEKYTIKSMATDFQDFSNYLCAQQRHIIFTLYVAV